MSVFKRQSKGNRIRLYVVIREHRYFPPLDGMVAATPEGIYEDVEKALSYARGQMKHLQSMAREDATVKDHTDKDRFNTLHEYRIWFDCKEDDKHTDRISFVVRRVDVFQG